MTEYSLIHSNEENTLKVLEDIHAFLSPKTNNMNKSEKECIIKSKLDFNASLIALIHLVVENRELLAMREVRATTKAL